jgi:DNA-binding winged helix-turn-helix (wHTH) protein/Flp pilus assembly protein TadD
LTGGQKGGKFPGTARVQEPMTEVSFGPFLLDPSSIRLLRDGVEVKLRPQAFQALRTLLRHSGQSIGYEQMMAEAWEGTFVSRHTVDVTIGEVRRSLGEYGRWITHRPKVGYCLEIPASDELVRTGWHYWNRRTREGADRAIECFKRATWECGTDFRAWEGLSTCYLMLATFGMRAPRDVYPEFLEAHARAVDAGGLRPELRCNRAHGLHMFEHRLAEAEVEFEQALRERPTYGTAYVRSALMYATLGRLDNALDALERASLVEPLLATLPATMVLVRMWRGELNDAIGEGRKAVELHPYLQISRVNYAMALECAGQLEEALEQYQLGSVMSPNLPWTRALEATCLVKMHRVDEARRILTELDELRRTEYVDAYYMALLRDALDQRSEAFDELERAYHENSAFLYSIDVDPKMARLRGEPQFGRFRRRDAGTARKSR